MVIPLFSSKRSSGCDENSLMWCACKSFVFTPQDWHVHLSLLNTICLHLAVSSLLRISILRGVTPPFHAGAFSPIRFSRPRIHASRNFSRVVSDMGTPLWREDIICLCSSV